MLNSLKPPEVYERFTDPTGRTWLVRVGEDRHKHIWVESDMGHRGLDGSIRKYTLTDGTEIRLIGPWNSNREAFETATGKKLT